jgi:putative peptidoglycan lipid II flippase
VVKIILFVAKISNILSMLSMEQEEKIKRESKTAFHSIFVASGILISRLFGLVRDRVFAHYFGNSAAADAFRAAFRIPNLLQNLFGEGVLSASFIPVYAGMEGSAKFEDAKRLAGAIAGILMLATSVIVLIGIIAAPVLIGAIAPGFKEEKNELAITLVRIFFPGAGFLVWSAWCLGILNSHGKFFLSYAAPVAWNLVIIVSMLLAGSVSEQFDLAKIAAFASVVGSILQLCVQMPWVYKILGNIKFTLNLNTTGVRVVLRNFFPVFIGRGIVQISAYIDSLIASLLPDGAVAAMSYAQTLYILPISLFGMSVSAAELPDMSRAIGSGENIESALCERLKRGLERISFFIIPSTITFIVLGDVIAGAIYQTGRFTNHDSVWVWSILAGYALGLMPTTFSRLYSSAFYALKNTRAPLKFAIIRVVISASFGYFAAYVLPDVIRINSQWGIAGLAVASGLSSWIEYVLLKRKFTNSIGKIRLNKFVILRLVLSAIIATIIALMIKIQIIGFHPVSLAIFVLLPFCASYLAFCILFKIEQVKAIFKIMKRIQRRINNNC